MRAESGHDREVGPSGGRSVLYIDMAYTLEIVRQKGHGNFFETRHSAGFFDRVWGVHPLADRAGSKAGKIETLEFSPRQTIVEGVSRSRNWPRFLAPLDFLMSQLSLLRYLLSIIRRNHVDLIVANDPFYGGLLAAILARLSGRPLALGIYANYDFAYQTFGALAFPRLFRWFWLQNIVARFVLRRADLVIGGTRNYLDWAMRYGARPDAGAVIPIARNIEQCHLADPARRGDSGEALRALGLPEGGRYMILVSRLIAVKFVEDGVRAMIEAARLDERAVGIVAGDGPMRAELEKIVADAGLKDRIRFIGHVPQEMLSRILPRCVAVSPLTGMALVEAGLGGAPAIAYDADWQAEFVEDGVNGLVVRLGDVAGMAEATARLLGDDELRIRMSKAMREKAVRAADRSAIAETEQEVFSRVLEKHGSRTR